MGSLLARPLSGSHLKHYHTLFDYVELIRSCLDPFYTILNPFPSSKNRNGIRPKIESPSFFSRAVYMRYSVTLMSYLSIIEFN